MPRKTNAAPAHIPEPRPQKRPLEKAPAKPTPNKHPNVRASLEPSHSSFTLKIKPTHKAIRAYYEELRRFFNLNAFSEGAVSPAFANLLRHCSRQFNWTLVEKYALKVSGRTLFVDGALLDNFKLVHGVWEAKDADDIIEKEIDKKFKVGYPHDNIIFQSPERAIIWQNGRMVLDADLAKPDVLVKTLEVFFDYEPPAFALWKEAVEQFKIQVPELAAALLEKIEQERLANKRFVQAFEEFSALCHHSINPNLSIQAVEDMLIQHVLTERIFRKVFNNSEFVERNAIAREIEKVVRVLTSGYFSRHEFLKPLDRFYKAIEKTAATFDDFSQKQYFLNAVYEKFFQGFSSKVADTHGIVYTPQPIVNFMVRSTENILKMEFGRSLSDKGVHILDPFVGTGNFIARIMREIQPSKLPYKYAHELHCNEVMLLPYYIASMNIEHEYYELANTIYQPFEGICLVDTFELAEEKQIEHFTPENTRRVIKQKATPIFVILGNPPYNIGQKNENDNNKKRRYQRVDGRIKNTYSKDSRAKLRNKVYDMYIKAVRWASDRISATGEGVVAFVTNNSFIYDCSLDGVRKHLEQDFNRIYTLDLGGDVYKNPKLSGTTHNVFGIKPGVSINFFIKKNDGSTAKVFYARTEEFWHKEERLGFLEKAKSINAIEWEELHPTDQHTWIVDGLESDFGSLLQIGTENVKAVKQDQTLFLKHSCGVVTSRDRWVYDFDLERLVKKIKTHIRNYDSERMRYASALLAENKLVGIDSFVNNDPHFIKWTDRLKQALISQRRLSFSSEKVRKSVYRPFCQQLLYFDDLLNQRRYQQHHIFPDAKSETENQAICVSGIGSTKQFQAIMINSIPCFDVLEKTQCFPFYTYSTDGNQRKENISDWALLQFQNHYQNRKISKRDIFYYIYAVLHHPQYRMKYAANLKCELPRIPFAKDFHEFIRSGEKLAGLHLNYEKQREYPLKHIEESHLNWRVKKMKLSKDKTQLLYNNFLTLAEIPLESFEYKLGNRSAIEWVIDQYQVKTDKRSGIVNDPNQQDDPDYIVRLIKKMVTISLETIKTVKKLPLIE